MSRRFFSQCCGAYRDNELMVSYTAMKLNLRPKNLYHIFVHYIFQAASCCYMDISRFGDNDLAEVLCWKSLAARWRSGNIVSSEAYSGAIAAIVA